MSNLDILEDHSPICAVVSFTDQLEIQSIRFQCSVMWVLCFLRSELHWYLVNKILVCSNRHFKYDNKSFGHRLKWYTFAASDICLNFIQKPDWIFRYEITSLKVFNEQNLRPDLLTAKAASVWPVCVSNERKWDF